jgi:hypothetical protein
MPRRTYPTIEDGDWFRPTHRNHRHRCCDCSLIHDVDFRVVDDGKVEVRFTRHARATAAARRKPQNRVT